MKPTDSDYPNTFIDINIKMNERYEQCNAFNEYFSSIGSKINNSINNINKMILNNLYLIILKVFIFYQLTMMT